MVESVASAFALDCIDTPIRRQFRCRTERNVWVTSTTKIGTDAKFLKFIDSKKTKDVYYSTSSWLDPIHLPRLREKTNHYPILLDHDVVFDIDVAPFSLQNIERARKYALEIFRVMNGMKMYQFHYVAFSGSKGFHLVYKDLAREKFSIPNPKKREERVREERHALVDALISMGCIFDTKITADTRRIIRVPGTFHGTTGWACTLLAMDVFMQPTKNWVHSIEKKVDAVGLPRWKRKKKTRLVQQKKVVEEGQPLLQINSRVSGTKQHHCLALVLNNQESPGAQVVKLRTIMLNECLPVAVQWVEEGKRYVLFPISKERAFVKKFLHAYQQKSLLNQFERLDHFWFNLPHEPNSIEIILNDKEVDSCFSRPHFEAMCKIVELHHVIESEVWMGNENPMLRVVVIE